MKFDNFIQEGKVRKASVDRNLIKSLSKTADNDLSFLKRLEIDETSSRKIMTGYYDVLRSVLEAVACLKGYKIYNHEAFTEFLKSLDENNQAIKFDRLRRIRNKINYYGEDISVEETKENINDIKEMIKIMKSKYLGDLE